MTDGRQEAFTLGNGTLEVRLWHSPGDPGTYGRMIAVSANHRQATAIEARVDGRPVAVAS